MPIKKSALRRVINEEIRRVLSEGPVEKAKQAIPQALKTYPAGQKVELSTLARQRELLGVHFGKIQSAAKALAKKGVIGYDGNHLVWSLNEADFRGSANQAKFKDLKPNQMFRMADDPSTATLVKTRDGGYEVLQPGDSGSHKGMRVSKREVDPNQKVIPGIVLKR